MEFYYTYVCPLCKENRDNSGLKQLSPPKCKTCGKKVVAVKIYMDYLEGYKKPFSYPVTEPTFEEAMNSCKVTVIDQGHRAIFNGQGFSFQSSDGPSNWTERMARQGALFSWARLLKNVIKG